MSNLVLKESPQSFRERWIERMFKIGVVVTGIDGVLETIGGAIFLCAARTAMSRFLTMITRPELPEDPDDWIANALRHTFNHLSESGKLFGGVYLLVHGAVKIFLVVCLLRGKLWAFPIAMIVLLGFMVYQGYRLSTHFS